MMVWELVVQILLIKTTHILQGGATASGTARHKRCILEFVVKILNKYTHKEFLKILF